jgi:hypothetical protein
VRKSSAVYNFTRDRVNPNLRAITVFLAPFGASPAPMRYT